MVHSESLESTCDDCKTKCKTTSHIIKCWASSKHFLKTNLIQLIPEICHYHRDVEMMVILRFVFLPQRASFFVWLEENGRVRKDWEKEMEWEREW